MLGKRPDRDVTPAPEQVLSQQEIEQLANWKRRYSATSYGFAGAGIDRAMFWHWYARERVGGDR